MVERILTDELMDQDQGILNIQGGSWAVGWYYRAPRRVNPG